MSEGPARGIERVEWVLGIVAGAAVLAIVGYLVWQGVTSGRTVPDLAVAASAEQPSEEQLRFTLSNRGSRAATGVSVALTLGEGDRMVARQRVVVDLVPAHADVEGGFVLSPGDARRTATLSVEGYLDP